MKTIQIKFGNSTIGFDSWKDAALYTILQIDASNNINQRQKTLNAIKELKQNANSLIKMSARDLKDFMFNE